MTIDPKLLRLSPSFTLDELVRSAAASDLGIINMPDEEQLGNLIHLCWSILQPARNARGPIHVSSGLRVAELNAHPRVGGSADSQHVTGQAADISGGDLARLYGWIKANTPYDQIIWEFGRWVHVSWASNPRRVALRAFKNIDGKTEYEPWS